MTLLTGLVLLLGCSSVLLASPAAAQPAASPPAALRDSERPPRDEPETQSQWYGWQTLTADGISLALTPLGVGIFGFWIGTPIVHAAHGNVGAAGGSLLLRLAGTLLPAYLWMAYCFELNLSFGGDEDWDSASGGESVAGHNGLCDVFLPAWGVVGVVGSIALDAAVLAYEDAPERDPFAVRVQPWVSAEGNGGLAVRGRF